MLDGVSIVERVHRTSGPALEFLAAAVGGRHGQHYPLRIVNVTLELEAVHHQECLEGRMPNPLVPVHERIILDPRESQRGRLAREVGMEICTTERHPRLCYRSLQCR